MQQAVDIDSRPSLESPATVAILRWMTWYADIVGGLYARCVAVRSAKGADRAAAAVAGAMVGRRQSRFALSTMRPLGNRTSTGSPKSLTR